MIHSTPDKCPCFLRVIDKNGNFFSRALAQIPNSMLPHQLLILFFRGLKFIASGISSITGYLVKFNSTDMDDRVLNWWSIIFFGGESYLWNMKFLIGRSFCRKKRKGGMLDIRKIWNIECYESKFENHKLRI